MSEEAHAQDWEFSNSAHLMEETMGRAWSTAGLNVDSVKHVLLEAITEYHGNTDTGMVQKQDITENVKHQLEARIKVYITAAEEQMKTQLLK